MKKSLLLGAALLSTVSAFAVVTDGDTYEPINDIKCVNAWTLDRNHNSDDLTANPVGNNSNARTCAVQNGVAYISSWAADDPEVTVPDGEGKPVIQNSATIYKFNVEDGSYIGALKLTIDGNRHCGTGVANQVGFDSFGHLYVADMSMASATEAHVYLVDEETGALTHVEGTLSKGGVEVRFDYLDAIGDLTGKEADCTIIAPASNSNYVFGWTRSKGDTEWLGLFENSTTLAFTEFYPASATSWGIAPSVKILPGETGSESEFWGELFYIDGFQSTPSLYNATGAIVESFGSAPDLAQKEVGANGVVEFSIDGRNFVAYPEGQGKYDWKVNICELGEGQTFEGMKLYWQIPASGWGTQSDGGQRYHGLHREYVKDAEGNEYVNLFDFKCKTGIALYKIGKYAPEAGVAGAIADGAATIAVNGGVVTVSAEAEEINVYNVAGQVVATAKNATEVAVPAQGAFIVKATVAGAPVVKKVVL